MTKTDLMRQIRDELFNLKESPLYEYRTSNNYVPVIGEGSHDAHIIFIGEAPGENEAKQGKPFCGASGRILDEMMKSIGLERKDVYVTNIVKDRPPENRDPKPDELNLYSPFLVRQIEIIKPKVIATLGRFSMTFVLELYNIPEYTQTISQNHGRLLSAKTGYGEVKIIPLYHPAVALYKASTKKQLLADFQILKGFIY
ncbi:MAG: uracil-DNA glycosylase [Candidatus Roizmanbacteria bacterium]